MATTNLALNQPAYNSAAWDVPLNANETILDNQFSSTKSIALTNVNVTLTSPNTSGTGQTQAMRIVLTGAISANIQVIIPSGISGRWIIYNTTSGSYTVTIASGGGGTSVVAPQGYNITLYSDGTNIRVSDDGVGTLIPILNVAGTSTFNGAATFNAAATFTGASTTSAMTIKNIAETVTTVSSGATGTINFDVITQSVLYYTQSSTSNFTLNVRGNGIYAINTLLSNGQSFTIVFLNTNGGTAYYNNVLQVDGSAQTVKWLNGVAPTAGSASAIDSYVYTIIKTASSTYTVLGSISKFA